MIVNQATNLWIQIIMKFLEWWYDRFNISSIMQNNRVQLCSMFSHVLFGWTGQTLQIIQEIFVLKKNNTYYQKKRKKKKRGIIINIPWTKCLYCIKKKGFWQNPNSHQFYLKDKSCNKKQHIIKRKSAKKNNDNISFITNKQLYYSFLKIDIISNNMKGIEVDFFFIRRM